MDTKMISMSRLWRMMVASALLLGAFGLGQQAVAGIATTKHNLGTGGTGTNHVTAGTEEICVFCHTPHAADTSAPVPLWNKQLNSAGGFTSYSTLNSSTMNAQFATDGAGGGSVGSISLACLSCHDGTQAMDNIINAPGSGGYDVTGGGANGLAYTWAVGARVDANGKLTNAATTLAMLGTDLSNDHPIGMQYCGGGPTQAAPATACNDVDFVAPANGSLGGSVKLWVDTAGGVASTREKTDMILYNRTFAAGVGPSVECASCHDPHTSVNATFLRVSNAGSAVCLSCHVK